MKYRNYSIDLLRGLAILGMVLAAVIPWNDAFPAWMYHAQISPPDFIYNPNKAGITWVDLVFPFFLFSMGAAFPFALKSKLVSGAYKEIVFGIFKRGILLVFFAIALAYFTPDNLTSSSSINYTTALAVFIAFGLVFQRFDVAYQKKLIIKCVGFLIIGVLCYYHSEILNNTFDKSKNNIIIMVLANVAVIGSFIWLMTASNIYLRIAVIVAFIGIWLTHDIQGSWTSKIWNFHPSIQWFYNFSYLKYLCIVLPGTILGDLVLINKSITNKLYEPEEHIQARILALISFIFIVFHVCSLYMRWLDFNLLGHVIFMIIFYSFFKKVVSLQLKFYGKLIVWGLIFVSVGLFFEPLNGGIKKDPSSFSYWFITSGLAFVFYCTCDFITKTLGTNKIVQSVVRCGQNPMMAYCISSFFITPILAMLGILSYIDYLGNIHSYLGLIRTLVYMMLVILLTNLASKKGWFWRS